MVTQSTPALGRGCVEVLLDRGAYARFFAEDVVFGPHTTPAVGPLPSRRSGTSTLNYAVYHDRYVRTPDGWRFTERVYEVRYVDTTPLAGSAPHAAGAR